MCCIIKSASSSIGRGVSALGASRFSDTSTSPSASRRSESAFPTSSRWRMRMQFASPPHSELSEEPVLAPLGLHVPTHLLYFQEQMALRVLSHPIVVDWDLIWWDEDDFDYDEVNNSHPLTPMPWLLPSLAAFQGNILDLQPHWPMERLKVVVNLPHDLPRLHPLSATLTILNLIPTVLRYRDFDQKNPRIPFTIANVVDTVSRSLPQLVHFAGFDEAPVEDWELHNEQPLTSLDASVRRFTRLETFTLVMGGNVESFQSPETVDAEPGRRYSADMEALAEYTIRACATLNRVVLGMADDDDVETAYTATLSQQDDGVVEVLVAVGADFDFTELSMFWN
ncbi:hypothetical protein MKEN_01448600 [Mycena kentingensis (nom. inval.)]|nr:hypothetical protein MKEN_01448600 [Mycena kentingensis (nom. inval.)]